MARVRELGGRDIEQYDSPNKGGRMSAHRGVVLHIAQGYYRGTIGWQMNPDQRYADGTSVTTSSTWVVGKSWGEWAQMVDSDRIAWAQRGGSETWLSIELEGFAPAAPTDWQVEACAQLLAWSAQRYGHPIARADHEGERGLGHHSMDRNVQWGHEQCPGSGVINAKNEIVRRAREIAEGDDMPSAKEVAEAVWGHNLASPPQGIEKKPAGAWQRYGRLAVVEGEKANARLAAIQAKLGGDDVEATVQRLLDEYAERERAERQAELGELAALVRQAQAGELDAAAVVDELARRLAGA